MWGKPFCGDWIVYIGFVYNLPSTEALYAKSVEAGSSSIECV